MRQTFSLALILIGLLCPATARAQVEGGGPDPATIRVRMGPLWMNPSIGISNLGIDQNVFNEGPDMQPKQDFTLTVTPKTDLWLRMGRSWLSASIDEEIVWFQQYASERSANTRYLMGWRLPSAWVNLNLSTSYTKARERPGYEIDVRVPRRELTYMGAVEGRIMSKTFFGVRGERQDVDFDEAAVFRDANLHDELNHVTTSGALTLRHQITPLTSIEVSATRSDGSIRVLAVAGLRVDVLRGGRPVRSVRARQGAPRRSASAISVRIRPTFRNTPAARWRWICRTRCLA